MTKIGVIVFPGSNCDHDAYYAIKNCLDVDVELLWHKESSLSNCDGIIIPGGFSYGDYLRSGSIAKFSPIMKEVVNFSKKGMPVLGICNGFQILVESDLLPGSLITNNGVRFISKSVELVVNNSTSLFTKGYKENQVISMPVAHKQGNYYASNDVLKKLQDNDQIAFKYQNNINGSKSSIAGILNSKKNILGMMPHPERASECILGSSDGSEILSSFNQFVAA